MEQQYDEYVSSDWHVGDSLLHPAFGVGHVTKVFGAGRKVCLAVRFPSNGAKIIDPALTPLQKEESVLNSLRNIEKALEYQELELKLLEKASALEKRRRKYKKADSAETWISRWIASPIAYLFPEKDREEWLGNMYEIHREMLHKGYSRWLVSLVDIGQIFILIMASLKIKLFDFFSIGVKKSE